MTLPTYTVALAPWHRHHTLIRAIRHQVFVIEQGVSEALETDPNDCHHTHALAHDHTATAVATARLQATGQIGRMAVLPAWRGLGIGGALLTCLLDTARTRGLTTLTLHAQVRATAFYAVHGFTATGDTYLEAGIPHLTMTRTLS